MLAQSLAAVRLRGSCEAAAAWWLGAVWRHLLWQENHCRHQALQLRVHRPAPTSAPGPRPCQQNSWKGIFGNYDKAKDPFRQYNEDWFSYEIR
jgi:hypothetical protein